MKKRNCFLLMVMFFALMAGYGCSGGGEDGNNQPASTQPATQNPSANDVRLLSAQQQADGRIRYVYGLPSSKIAGSKARPFAQCNIDDWSERAISDSDSDNLYELAIVTFDRHNIRCIYGGDKAQNSWADIKSDPLYNSAVDALNFDAIAGQNYKNGTGPDTTPGQRGDDFLRFTKVNSIEMLMFMDMNQVKPVDAVGSPIIFTDLDITRDGWEAGATTIFGSSGWSVISLTPSGRLHFTFGRSNGSNISWVDGSFTTSKFFWEPTNAFCVDFSSGEAESCR